MSESEILVLVDDLERFKESLNAAYFKSLTEDLVETYRTLNRRQQTSPLTKDLEQSLEKASSYLKAGEDTKEEE